jgi:hypothetical protein
VEAAGRHEDVAHHASIELCDDGVWCRKRGSRGEEARVEGGEGVTHTGTDLEFGGQELTNGVVIRGGFGRTEPDR